MTLPTVVSLVDPAGAPGEPVEAAIAALVAEGATGPSEVAAFTDEELTALDGAREPVAARPWWESRPAAEQVTAVTVALRGLVARGLVIRLDEHQDGQERLVLSLPDEVAAVLEMRRRAAAIVLAERRTAAGKHFRYLYLHGDAALQESVNPGGLHTFTVLAGQASAADLACWCDPGAAAGRDGAAEEVALSEIAAGRELPGMASEALATTVVIAIGPALRADGEPVQARLSVPARRARVVGGSSRWLPGHLTVREVSGATLAGLLRDLIGVGA